MFAAIDSDDIKAYKVVLNDFQNTGKRFDIALEALEDIKAPSRDKINKAVEALIQNDDTFRTDFYKTLKKLNPFVTPDMIDDAIDLKEYEFLSNQLINAIGPIKGDDAGLNKFYSYLKSNGYNAIMDYHDIDAGISKAPVIVFDKTVLSKIGETQVTKADKLKIIDELINTPTAPITIHFGKFWLKNFKNFV